MMLESGRLHYLDAEDVTTWDQMVEKFMKRFFPPTENAKRRKDITNFKQKDRENLEKI